MFCYPQHNHNIIHRDIKAENILVCERKIVKVADFGFSTRIETKDQLLSTFCGSPPYAAPELFHDESYVGPCVDYWALGILLYFMVTSLMPFKAQTISALKKLIIECDYEIPEYMSDECISVINGLLQVDCNHRWDLKRLKDSEWLRGQTFADELPQFKLKTWSKSKNELNNNICLIPEERQAYAQLNELGIDDALIADHLDKGSRSAVTGSFSIIINKILRSNLKSNESLGKNSINNHCQRDGDDQLDHWNQSDKPNVTNDRRCKSPKPVMSVSKSFKSIRNIFADRSVGPKLEKTSSLGDQNLVPVCRQRGRRLRKSKTCCLL